jgi:hypothetical protein
MKRVITVVGDAYSEFAIHTGVLSASSLVRELREEDQVWRGDECVIVGQGISDSAMGELRRALDERGITDVIWPAPRASLSLTHKSSSAYVLITDPKRMGERTYEFDCVLGSEVDRLSDHVTGQHVSAMLLMEAARQAIIATVELEYTPPQGESYSFLVEQYGASFTNYAFPVPTTIRSQLFEVERKDRRIALTSVTQFYQTGLLVSEMRMSGAIFQRKFLQAVEMRQARKAASGLQNRSVVQLPSVPLGVQTIAG